MGSEILLLIILDGLKHVKSSVMEVLLKVKFFVSQEVNQCSLLYVLIFRVNPEVLHLLFSSSQVSQLFFFSNVSPHGAQLLGLVSSVDIVEVGELGAKEVREMSGFDNTKVPGEDEFVMEDHTSDPLIVRPSSHS